MKLSFEASEVICDLPIGEINNDTHAAILLQKQVTRNLIDMYLAHDTEIVYDKWKLNRYRQFAQYQVDLIVPDSITKTETIYDGFDAYRTFYRIVNWVDINFESTYSKAIEFAGINHGTILVVDLLVILKHVYKHFFHSKKEEDKHNRLNWKKFLNLLNKDDRPARISKSFLWLMTNITLILITGGFSVFLNLGMLALDISISFLLNYRLHAKNKRALQEVKKDVELQPLIPFIEKTVKFQKSKNDILQFLAMAILGITFILIPQISIPIFITYSLIAVSAIGVLHHTYKLGLAGLRKISDELFKGILGSSTPKTKTVSNEPKEKLEEQEIEEATLITNKKIIADIVQNYKKQCSALNFYGKNRADELLKKIDYAQNLDYLRNEIACFVKTGKTESDYARYNFFRSTSRASGTNESSLRTKLYTAFFPQRVYYNPVLRLRAITEGSQEAAFEAVKLKA